MKIKPFYAFTILVLLLILTSCGIGKVLSGKSTYYYPGTATLADGKQRTGYFEMPSANASELKLFSEDNGGGVKEVIPSKEVTLLEVYNQLSPEEIAVFEYLPLSNKEKKLNKAWVYRLSKAENLTAYVGAEDYSINSSGSVMLIGTRQVINHGGNQGSTVIQPSYPVYLMKRDDKSLNLVGLHGGVEFEGSALRSGLVRFLADDPKLCDYILDRKLEYNNIDDIVHLYNPNRGDAPLIVDGKEFTVVKRFFTNALNNELIFTLELGKPLDENYGVEFGLGVRSSFFKFVSYGADIGMSMMKTVDEEKRIENHLMHIVTQAGGWENVPVIPEDMVNGVHFRFNAYIGGQLPMDLGKIYLIPAAHISLGGMFGANYGAVNYGPMFNLDLGFPLKHGSVMLVGAGYRHSIPIVSEESRLETTYPGFSTYSPFNTLFLRVGFKF